LLRRAGRPRTYPPTHVIFEQGDRSDFALLIEEGQVTVERRLANGRPIVMERGVGDLIGEFGCIDRARRSATVIAKTQVTAIMIEAHDLRRTLRRESLALYNLLTLMIRRVRESDRLRLDFGTASGVEQVYRKLITLAEESGHGGQGPIRLRITGDSLAEAAGVSTSTVWRAHRKLKEQGLISTEHGLEILDLDGLRALAAGERR
jgi:CRP/FNR family cyclic AMP-dependent transcriptional regulator